MALLDSIRMSDPTLADDCEGLSQRQLEDATTWSQSRVNNTLCSLTIHARSPRQVESFKEKGPRGRKTAYRIRRP